YITNLPLHQAEEEEDSAGKSLVMNNMSRHRACKLCRDRKVRCDGNQPVCDKCRRLGENCVYSPTYKPTKADLAQTIESLRDRIDTAESIFVRQNTSAPPSHDLLAPVTDSAMSIASLDFTPFASPTDQFFSPHRNGQTITQSPKKDDDFLNNLPMMLGNDISGFLPENMTMPEDHSENLMTQRFRNGNNCYEKIPSLREIRALNSNSSSSLSSPGSKKSDQHVKDSSRILAELQTFSSTIFQTQTEIAGISSAVAEYLAWLRNVPGMPKTPDCTAVLETLETRVREVHEMAENRHWAAWKQMLEKLDGASTQLGAFGAELQERTAGMAQVFHTSYDVGKAIQKQNIGSATG
ncbi:MAG: hypothetical protein Q9217_006578, partial [Psora testacea]